MNIRKVSKNQKSYPALLKEIYDPPEILYVKGTLPSEEKPKLAVVGARKMTPYGKAVLNHILPPIIRNGIEIISGLAIGIDGEAHRITLEHGGVTHAVLGSGLDESLLYPQIHKTLANEIVQKGGSLLSEHDTSVPPLPRHFAMRNRIIAGLSHGVLIVEAAEKSGSLITADFAINHGRDVFAIPGDITKRTADGTNELIKNGAHIVTHANDILSLFQIDNDVPNTEAVLKNSDPILFLLKERPMHIDAIRRELDLTVTETSARLSKLEITGEIKNIGNMHYIKN